MRYLANTIVSAATDLFVPNNLSPQSVTLLTSITRSNGLAWTHCTVTGLGLKGVASSDERHPVTL